MSIAFLLTTLVVVATPGTGVVYTLAAALSRGRRASIVAAVGCTLGIVPHLLATVTGVAALLHASATAFQVLKYAGVAYLLYMAWATVRDKEALVVEEQRAAPVSARRVRAGCADQHPQPEAGRSSSSRSCLSS
jgi:threonine/homoserine/homoserine lactone efflux protein